MEKTLEVRWFFKELPPTVVEHWFKFKCPGKFVHEIEIRKDWYACQQHYDLRRSLKHLSRSLDRESINFKSREGNLELKLRQQKLGTHQLYLPQHSYCCEGNIEQWCKFSQQELKELNFNHDTDKIAWIGVEKERQQKVERGVKSELTKLRLDRDRLINSKHRWWTIAFEMSQNESDRRSYSYFTQVVEQACETYPEPQLLATNSYSYSHWLLESDRTIPSQENSTN